MGTRRIGVLTGGGDTTALNATLKGVALGIEKHGLELIGFMEGWAGVLSPSEESPTWGRHFKLTSEMIHADRGGTLLRSSRTNLVKVDGGIEQAVQNLKSLDISGLIPIGGDDTLSVGAKLAEHFTTTFVTKTVDNDVGTNASESAPVNHDAMLNYFCPGFPTAALRIAQFAGDLRTTAYSHNRIIVLEAMGRDAGWLALSGAYGHADIILVPEVAWDPEPVIAAVERIYRDQGYVIIVASEGLRNPDGTRLSEVAATGDTFRATKAGGCSEKIAEILKAHLAESLKTEAFNHIIPSYLCRCGSPIPLDRDIAISLGQGAVDAIVAEKINHVATVVRRGDRMQTELLEMSNVLPRDEESKVIPRDLDTRFYDLDALNISEEGLEYFRPILGERCKAYRLPERNTQQF